MFFLIKFVIIFWINIWIIESIVCIFASLYKAKEFNGTFSKVTKLKEISTKTSP
jgi:hypothetical protein